MRKADRSKLPNIPKSNEELYNVLKILEMKYQMSLFTRSVGV